MYAFAALNLAALFLLSIAAMVSAFTLPPEVPAVLCILAYIPFVYHLFCSAADNDGDYSVPVSALWKVIAWIILVFSVIYWKSGLMHAGEQQSISFIDSVYFSVTTWTTLGYGDFSPSPRIRHITSIEALLGYIGMGLWICVLGLWIAQRTEIRKSIHDHNRGLTTKARANEEVEPTWETPVDEDKG